MRWPQPLPFGCRRISGSLKGETMSETTKEICFLSVNPIPQSSSKIPVAPATSSLLDTQSTSAPAAPPNFYREFALEPFKAEYQAVVDAYDSLFKIKVVQRLEKCRMYGTFMRNKATGQVRVSSTSCHVRGCPMCAAAKAKRVAKATADYLADEPDAKFMTLTMKHTDEPLQLQLERITKYFRAFRRQKEISKRIKGGFWFLEIKLGKDDLWHIHLHCLVISPWISQKELSALWLNVTGESYIVDIRKVKDAKTAANYAAKYASKPAELRYLPLTNRQQLIEATRNVRTYGTWGAVKKAKLLAKPVYVADEWQKLGSWRTVLNLLNYDKDASAIFRAWKTGEPLEDGISLAYVDTFIENPEAIPINPVNQVAEQFGLW